MIAENDKKIILQFAKKSAYRGTRKAKFKFDWEGGLSDLKKKYTSVELQHKTLEWR